MDTQTDFVDDGVRSRTQLVFLLCGFGLSAFLFGRGPIDYGSGVVDEGKIRSVSIRQPVLEEESNSEATDRNPRTEQAEPPSSDSELVRAGDPSESPTEPAETDEEVETEETQTAVNPPSTQPAIQETASFQIIAGSTAPHYCLKSVEAMKRLAMTQRCRFIVTDGDLSVEIGRDLQGASMRTITSSWHDLYAKRMVPLPDCDASAAAIRRVRKRYTKFGKATCFLSVPHDLDRKNLRCTTSVPGRQLGRESHDGGHV